MIWFRLSKRIARPLIRSERELTRYVWRIAGLAIAAALAFDVANHLIFFDGWTEAVRSWLITVCVAGMIAAPIARAVGRAHLELYGTQQLAEKLSRTDPLTGLPNRRAILDYAQRESAQAIVLVIVDIDRFKRVNDSYGHLVGDTVIQAVTRIMAEELRSLGLVGRLGGEEFALVASDVPPQAIVTSLLRFRDRIAGLPIVANGVAVTVTVSAGAGVRDAGLSFDQLYAEADQALYQAKAAGRNRVVLSPRLEARVAPFAMPDLEDTSPQPRKTSLPA